MNKLIVNDSEISLKEEKVILDINAKDIKINIEGTVEIDDISNIDLNLELNINDNSNLIYNKVSKNNNLNLIINESKNCNIIYNESIIATKETNINVDSNINNSNNNCIINIHCLTKDDGFLKAVATGKIKDKIENIDMLENIRILMLNDKESIIIPNLLVSSNNVKINHNATISGVDEDYLFYLSSKGISYDKAVNLIAEGFLKNNISDNLKEGIEIE